MHCRQFRGRQKSVQYARNPCMPGILFIPVSHNGSGWQKAPAAEVPGKLNTKDRHYTTARMAAGERKAIDLSEDGGRRAIDLSGPGDQDFRTKHATCAYCKRRVQVLEEFCLCKICIVSLLSHASLDSTATFDVHGPPDWKYPTRQKCRICSQRIRRGEDCTGCGSCGEWSHKSCQGIGKECPCDPTQKCPETRADHPP